MKCGLHSRPLGHFLAPFFEDNGILKCLVGDFGIQLGEVELVGLWCVAFPWHVLVGCAHITMEIGAFPKMAVLFATKALGAT